MDRKEQGWAGRPVWQLFLPSRRVAMVTGKWEVTSEVAEAAGLEQDLGMDCILKARNGEREVGKDQNDPQVILPFLPLPCHFPLSYHHRKNEKEPVRQLLCSVKARS